MDYLQVSMCRMLVPGGLHALFLSFPRQPSVGESHWRMLLQDMLTMQQHVYTCLDSSACYEVTQAIK
jgi:hypothetical protein